MSTRSPIAGTIPQPDSEQAQLVPRSGSADIMTNSHLNDVHTRTGENSMKIWIWAITPLILHFLIVLILTIVIKLYIAGHHFNLQSRKALLKFTPLQSDITTAISSCIAMLRFFATMWSASMIWRCVFILMGNEGISLEQIDRLLTWQVHLYPRLKSSQVTGLFVSIILLAALPCQLSGPILTGSITWTPSHVTGEQKIIDHIGAGGAIGLSVASLSLNLSGIVEPSIPSTWASGLAGTAWHGSQDDARVMKRVIRSVAPFPINSTLNNVTLPYFTVTNFEWVKDPKTELPQELIQSVLNATDSAWNPFAPFVANVFALAPDGAFGVLRPPSPYTGIIEETRAVFGCYDIGNNGCNAPNLFGDMPPNIHFYSLTNDVCCIYGRVTYVAGAAECRNCRISSWLTVQNDTTLTVSPSTETMYAIGMMPKVGGLMVIQNVSLPKAFNNLNGYVSELLARSYSASWTLLTDTFTFAGTDGLATDVQIAVLTSRADVLWWRVWLWLSINLMFTLSGLLFLFVHRICNQPLIGNPSMAALLLDATDVLHRRHRALCNFSTLVGEDKGTGYLHLQPKAIGTHRSVKFVEN